MCHCHEARLIADNSLSLSGDNESLCTLSTQKAISVHLYDPWEFYALYYFLSNYKNKRYRLRTGTDFLTLFVIFNYSK